MSLQIHWHEGLFLQPHHLQRFQKSVFDLVAEARTLQFAYPYGVIEMKLSYDELQNSRLRFDRLRVITRGGVEIDFPRNADLPIVDIKTKFAKSKTQGFLVKLAIPYWKEERQNCIDLGANTDARAKIIYRVTEHNYPDENSGINPKSLQVRHLNARLILDDEDESDMETIPLLRIIRSTGDEMGSPKQDPKFSPPCLLVNASPALREIVQDISAVVDSNRKELTDQITRGAEFDMSLLKGPQIEQVLRLRTLNRFAARMPAMVDAPGIPPFTWYLEMRELLSELVALKPGSKDYDVAPYDHDNPVLNFDELSAKIRLYLKGTVRSNKWEVAFRKEGDWFSATLEEKHFTVPSEYFFGIRTRQDSRALAELVENKDEFKFMSKSKVDNAFNGVPLQEERIVPHELPPSGDWHYFRLDRKEGHRMWEAIQREKAIGVRWNGADTCDYQLTLFMIVPPDAEAKK